jgi:two-component system KDP operon response regulator KdpE
MTNPANQKTILIVEDEPQLTRYLSGALKLKQLKVLTAANGLDALEIMESEVPDMIILDIMMPKMDGFEVCRRVREWSQVPIIMLSARQEEQDKVKCLNLGADDFLTKPFGVEELLARINAVFRRTSISSSIIMPPVFSSEGFKFDFVSRQVTVHGDEVLLTPTEYNLLRELVINAGKVLTHAQLLKRVWGPEYETEKEYLHVFIQRVRTKLEKDPKAPKFIVTISGVGYQFRPEV